MDWFLVALLAVVSGGLCWWSGYAVARRRWQTGAREWMDAAIAAERRRQTAEAVLRKVEAGQKAVAAQRLTEERFVVDDGTSVIVYPESTPRSTQ